MAVVVGLVVALGLDASAVRPGQGRVSPPPVGRRAPARTASAARPPPGPVWRLAWASSPAWGYGYGDDTTVRELVRPAVGGAAVRVQISNLFGDRPLVVSAATVAPAAGGGAGVVPGSLRTLLFAGRSGVTVPQGEAVYSDPASLAVAAGQELAVSLWVSGADLVTIHPCCLAPVVSYATSNGAGNQTASTSGAAFGYASPWYRWVDALSVLAPAGTPGSIVVVGDSISDGFNSTLRWTDVLQRRIDLLPPAYRRAVVNEAITANTLTDVVPNDDRTGGGPPGLARLGPDALDQPGVSVVVLFLGTNDLFFGAPASEVIVGLAQAAARVHAAGMRVVGVTLLPRLDSERWDPVRQAYLQQIDQWILGSHAFDGVLNFASVVADMYGGACLPGAFYPPYDSGDNLHPDAAGATALADSVDTTDLGLPPAPRVPELVPAVPTPGCPGLPGIPPG